jgi:hypothetical protein
LIQINEHLTSEWDFFSQSGSFQMQRRINALPLVLLTALIASSSFAEEQKILADSLILIPGALGRVESYGPVGQWRLCSPQSIGLTEWRPGFLERLIKPNNSQMELLGKLQVASAAAKNAIASSCAKETIPTGPSHFAEMEKRVSGLLNAVKVLREPYEAFYASLDNRQKAALDGLGPGRHGWPW